MRIVLLTSAAILTASTLFGRGEPWMPKPPTPPSVATLTNESRYIEWKFREDVTDKSTGLDADALRDKVDALRQELGPETDWRIVKAKCYALVCDEMAIDVSPLDWYPSFSVWNRYNRPLEYFKCGRQREIYEKYYPEVRKSMDEGNKSGRWSMWVDFDHSVPVWEDLIEDGFPGVLELIDKYDDGSDFYKSLRITADASVRLIKRMAAQGRRNLQSSEVIAKPRR